MPDALASAAQQLVNKGWQRGVHWAYEVRAPKSVDCTMGVPEVTRPLGEWLKQGFVPAYGRKPSAAELAEPASLLQPEGIYGPSFLTLKNYYVIKQYNFSDLYVLYRRSSERSHRRSAAVRDALEQGQRSLRTADVESMQRTLAQLGLYKDKVDGKAGMQTRSALGAYQKANNLKVDCWPTGARARSHAEPQFGRPQLSEHARRSIVIASLMLKRKPGGHVPAGLFCPGFTPRRNPAAR